MIMKLYRALLWFFGFKNGEYVTYMLRRQEARLHYWWWFLVIQTGFGFTILWHYLFAFWVFLVLSAGTGSLVALLAWHVGSDKIEE